MRAAIYARLSVNPEGVKESTATQVRDCTELCARLGITVASTYVDDSISAWRREVKRPGWESLVEAVEAKALDAIVVWHVDRLMRQPRDLEKLIDLAESGLKVISYGGATRDLNDPDDRYILRIEVAHAARSSDDTSRRVRRGLLRNAEQGRPHPGGLRAYGYEPGGLDTRDEEAAILREIGRRVLAGDSLRAVARDLNERHVPTVKGGEWTPTSLRTMLLSPRVAGLRSHNGEIVGKSQWPAVLDEDDWYALRGMFSGRSPDRVSPGRVHLLSGIACCGLCEGVMQVHHRNAARFPKSAVSYRCHGCRRVVMKLEWLDNYVTDATLATLERQRVAPSETPSDHRELEARIGTVQLRLRQITEEFADDPEFTPDQLRAMNRRLNERLSTLLAERARLQGSQALHAIGSDVRAEWPTFDLSRRRAIVSAVFSRIAVHPAPGKRVFDPTRVELVPR